MSPGPTLKLGGREGSLLVVLLWTLLPFLLRLNKNQISRPSSSMPRMAAMPMPTPAPLEMEDAPDLGSAGGKEVLLV